MHIPRVSSFVLIDNLSNSSSFVFRADTEAHVKDVMPTALLHFKVTSLPDMENW